MRPEADLVGLARQISDGSPVAWDQLPLSDLTTEDQEVVRNLQLVETLARAQREFESPSTDSDLGPAWGSLRRLERIGEGAFGEVYRAWDPKLERAVALKLLKAEMTTDAARIASVVQEGRLMARLSHPGVISVHGADTHDGRVGIWMELVRGRSLDDLIREQGRMGAREAAVIGIALCRALAAVHAAGLVHRDVKTRNVMREEGGRILLMDFGASIDPADLESILRDGCTGTPLYMAPELLRGSPASARSDLYSLGVLLYNLVADGYPVEAASLRELRLKHERREYRLLGDRRPDLPETFVRVIEQAIDPDPEQRFVTVGWMEKALATSLGIESPAPEAPVAAGPATAPAAPTRSPARRAIPLAALALAVVGGVWIWQRNSVTAPLATGGYAIEAALQRVADSGVREPIGASSRVAPGDRLTLEFQATRPVHLYLINEDDQGHAYALFPLPGLEQGNPLSAGVRHELPGRDLDGKTLSWMVDSAGGRERLLLVASPSPLPEFEAAMRSLPRPAPGQIAVEVPGDALVRLRGMGGFEEVPGVPATEVSSRLFALARQLSAGREEVAGVYVRQVELANPLPPVP